jgi:proteic killer suppression protein
MAIKNFAHKGLERFFLTGSKAGIQAAHELRLKGILFALTRAADPADMAFPGWGLHELQGKRAGTWAVKVSGNWRVTFRFIGNDANDVDYEDYHDRKVKR